MPDSLRVLPSNDELDHRKGTHDDEEEDSHGTGTTQFAISKTGLINIADKDLCTIVWPALSHEVRLSKDLKMQNDLKILREKVKKLQREKELAEEKLVDERKDKKKQKVSSDGLALV